MTTRPTTRTIRLSHPWNHCEPLTVLDLPAAEAARLIRAGVAVDFDTLVTSTGGGWFDVTLANPRRIVRRRGLASARLAVTTNGADKP
jgi:hypothetical protein